MFLANLPVRIDILNYNNYGLYYYTVIIVDGFGEHEDTPGTAP